MAQSTLLPVKIVALKDLSIISDKCVVADRPLTRMKGLIGRHGLAAGEGMLFPRTNSVHMWFMRIAIDVVFAKRAKSGRKGDLEVTSVREGVKPWKLLPVGDWRASYALELPAGTVGRLGIARGDLLGVEGERC